MTTATTLQVPVWDLWINQANDTQTVTFQIINGLKQPVTVDGWTGRAQVRKFPTDSTILHEWSLAHSNIVIAGTTAVLLVAPADTSAWTWRRAQYDLVLTDLSGKPHRASQGRVFVNQGTTY